jgi:DNA-binding CsgD family transcriptional regulator
MVSEALRIARGLGDDATAADALAQLCWLSFTRGDLGDALDQVDEAVALARATGDPRLTAYVLGRRAVFKSEAGDLDAARGDQEEAIALSRAAGNNYRLVVSLANLGVDKLLAGDHLAARTLLVEASTLADDHGYQTLSGGLRENLGFIDLIDADPRNAARHFTAGLNTARITGVTSYVHGALLGLALAAGADSDPAAAATLHGIADERYERAGLAFESIEAGLRDRDHARLRATMGDAAFEASYQRGHALSQTEADVIALVTAVTGPDLWAPAPAASAAALAATGGPTGPLSDREREIVALLAGGATDGQIADRLFLSVNTVRSHLERIRDKTGARRRTELARYAIAAGIDPVTPAR